MTPAGALSKAYSNSLLVLLNNRGALRQKRDNMTVGNSVTLPQLQSTRPIQINVNQETYAEGNLAMVDLSTDKVRTTPSVASIPRIYNVIHSLDSRNIRRRKTNSRGTCCLPSFPVVCVNHSVDPRRYTVNHLSLVCIVSRTVRLPIVRHSSSVAVLQTRFDTLAALHAAVHESAVVLY